MNVFTDHFPEGRKLAQIKVTLGRKLAQIKELFNKKKPPKQTKKPPTAPDI